MGVNVLSLFDGMACGMLAMQRAGLEVDKYYAYEIDKYAIKTATYNFPVIQECGDVFEADFTQYKDIDYIVGGSPCFTKGHFVLTEHGYKDISKITVGDSVLTHTGAYKKVIRTNQREAEIYELTVMGYPTFKTTAEHPFYTIKKRKATASEYKQLHTWRIFSETPAWVAVKDLDNTYFCGQHIITTEGDNEYAIDTELAYLLGRYVADGHLRKTKRKKRKNSYQYQVVLSIGEQKVEQFKQKVTTRHFSCYKHTQSVYRCVFSSMHLVNFIEAQGFGVNAYTKCIPEFIYNLPVVLQKAFLEGYTDGDGCYIQQADAYNLTTVSPKLAYGLQRLITSVYNTNVTVRISDNKREHGINGRVVKANYPLYTILFKQGIRKQSVAHIQDGIVWTQVKSVARTEKTDTVYNIEVEEDNSYTVNNCIVHNCTYWSIAQKNNRETEASGLGWELFSQYVRAVNEVKPKFFIYENNKSMSKAIRASITETFGFEPICINSALVSAQNRQRLYWVGKLQADGTYCKVNVEQPEDKHIYLKDIIESTYIAAFEKEDSTVLCVAQRGRDKGSGWEQQYEVNTTGKTNTLTKVQKDNLIAEAVNTTNGKTQTLKAQYAKSSLANFIGYNSTYGATGVAESVCMRYTRDEDAKRLRKQYEAHEIQHGFREHSELQPRTDGKTNTLSTVLKDNPICEPVIFNVPHGWNLGGFKEEKSPTLTANGAWQCNNFITEPVLPLNETVDGKAQCVRATCYKDGIRNLVANDVDKRTCVAERVPYDAPHKVGEIGKGGQGYRVYTTEGKAVAQTANSGGLGSNTGLYACPVEYVDGRPIKAQSYADGKVYNVHEVQGSRITIKDKTYNIKLPDGFYIIRKLTVAECKRLQTVPDWYDFTVVSNTSAYKMLGNGWTVDVIAHLITSCIAER